MISYELYIFLSFIQLIHYGATYTYVEKKPRGPRFIEEPDDVIFDLSGRSQQNYASIRCQADAYPAPEYTWYKEEYVNNKLVSKKIDPLSDTRLTQTDGTLLIYNPNQATDKGKYHCKAKNDFGSIITRTVQLSFGFIGEFNKIRSKEYGRANWGKSISCDPPQHYPKVNYYWSKNKFPTFVEEARRVFVSHDGNLYFSSLEITDNANYSCNVQSVISSTGRTGPFFKLIVEPAPNNEKLLFPNNFPKTFPEAPLAGEKVRMECLAYGYPVPTYNWTRSGISNQLPRGSYTTNHNRVLIIPKVKVEDMGSYSCKATSGRDEINKAVTLSIQSLPTFTMPLEDTIMNVGDTINWTCKAFGIPDVKYIWFKNGERMNDYDLFQKYNKRYRIKDNVLTIQALSMQDNGMYQCEAINQLGSKFSSGQLKVMTMKPSFSNFSIDPEMYAAIGSNYTIPCNPEAVPKPQFQWRKQNQRISDYGRIRKLPNGHLFINSVSHSDQGEYTCVASNEYGTAKTSGFLTVFDSLRIIEMPPPKVVANINQSIELKCDAYIDQSLDVTFIWLHNQQRINFSRMPQFSVGSQLGYLKISNITFAEVGKYTCVVKTSVGNKYTEAELIVHGPPSRPGAVLADSLTSTSAKVHWSDGSNNGRNILGYVIQGRTNHNSTWVTLAPFVTNVQREPNTNRRIANLNQLLSPWSNYKFRVSALNDLGRGRFSNPSPLYVTEKDKPFKYPLNVGGGGGKAGTLTILWDPLPPQDWNSDSIWYKIYYKPADSDIDYFEKEIQKSIGNTGMYTVTVGDENYYKKYHVKVQAINSMGSGPTSKRAEVYSAESMPQITPSRINADPFNSTALNVSWAPIDLNRENIRGNLIGHRIKYWREGENPEVDALTVLKRGEKNWGLVVALQPNTKYYVSVMAYNDAGSGPESEPFLVRTYKAAPQKPPTSVIVVAMDSTTIHVTWRGVTQVTSDEEPIIGYKVRYWEADQPIAKAKEVYKYLDGEDLEAFISGLEPRKSYKLRVLAYSLGGDGKMSSPAWEFKLDE